MVEPAGKHLGFEPVVGEALECAVHPLVAHVAVAGAGEDREPLVSGFDQPVDQQPLTADRIAEHARHRVVLGVAIVQHDRHVVPLEKGELRRCQARRGDRAVHPVAPNLRQHLTRVAFVLQREQQHPDALRVEPLGQFGEDLRIVEVGEVRD